MIETSPKVPVRFALRTAHYAAALLIAAAAVFICADACAQKMLTPQEKADTVAFLTRNWNDWKTASVSGKLKTDGLPVTPTVKIWMVRDRLIRLSLRAPFVGEVGRAEIVDSTLLVVNKMNRVYSEESLREAFAAYPGGISYLQDLLLGRMVIPGSGLLSERNSDMVEIYAEEDGTSTVVASDGNGVPGFNYGYSVDEYGWPAALMVIPESNPEIAVSILFSFFQNGYDIAVAYQNADTSRTATLELSEPKWEGKGFDALKNVDRYTRLPLSEFIKSF